VSAERERGARDGARGAAREIEASVRRQRAGVIAATVGLGAAAAAAWWWSARRGGRPCPSWMSWVLDNPYMNSVAGTAAVLDALDLAPDMRVLDAGCGPGRLTIPAAERVGPTGEVVALDVQEGMLARLRTAVAARGLRNVTPVRGTLDSTALAAGMLGGPFDRAFLVTVLGEVADRAAAMRALHAALRPGGLLAVTEALPDPDYQGRRTVRQLTEAAGFELVRARGSWLAFTMVFRRPRA
jgi:SAM-dependent methyltransferase